VDLDETPTEAAFRADVRGWLATGIPAELRGSQRFEDRLQIDRLLAARGLLAYTWPKEFGGPGGGPIEAAILDEESGRAGIALSRSPSRMGTNLLGPAIMAHGSDEQKRRLLPRILRVEDIWCQGFSEPAAGSDLANVQCLAADDGAQLRLSGSKLWTSQATHATWCFVLARTDPAAPRHKNLSMLLVPMDAPGIQIRPLVQLTGEAEFSQVFFDDVRVAKENVLGGLGSGWAAAMTVLGAERSYGLFSRHGTYAQQLLAIAALLKHAPSGPSREAWLVELGALFADLTGIRHLAYKIASLAAAKEDLGSLSSVSHVWWTDTHQKIADLGWRVAAAVGRDEDRWYRLFLESRAETIYGGTAQIQRNIIAERALGLPR
jgi:alkylation response protein AidB-like acyl-CoA dehydrogenase